MVHSSLFLMEMVIVRSSLFLVASSAVVPSQFFAVAAEAEHTVSMHSECSEKHRQMLWRQQQLLQLLSAI